MSFDQYRICISSPPDRDFLVAEIFFNEIQWAEINQEHSALEVEFYSHPSGVPWKINLLKAIEALKEAERKLLNN